MEGALRKSLWAEAGNTAINLMNIQVSQKTEKTPYEKFSGQQELPRYVNNLHSFGEVGIILKGGKIRSKIIDRGQRAIMVGYGVQNGNEVSEYKYEQAADKFIPVPARHLEWFSTHYIDSDAELKKVEETCSCEPHAVTKKQEQDD